MPTTHLPHQRGMLTFSLVRFVEAAAAGQSVQRSFQRFADQVGLGAALVAQPKN